MDFVDLDMLAFILETVITLILIVIFGNKLRLTFKKVYQSLYEKKAIQPILGLATTEQVTMNALNAGADLRSYQEDLVSYEGYDAQNLGESADESSDIMRRLKAPSYDIAQEVLRRGFPDYQTYKEAVQAGYNTYSDWQLAQERRKLVANLAKKVKRISIDDFMAILNFTDRPSFYQWLLNLPQDILVVDGDYVVFTWGSSDSSPSDVDAAIDRLLAEFSSLERSKQGKV